MEALWRLEQTSRGFNLTQWTATCGVDFKFWDQDYDGDVPKLV